MTAGNTRSLSHVRSWIVALCTLPLCCGVTPGRAAEGNAATPTGRHWAVLIGIQKYKTRGVSNLIFTVNDVKQICSTLKKRGGYTEDCILEMTDNSPERFQPSKRCIETEVADWLAKPARGDTLLFYFSGHGFLDAAGALYLAGNDVDPEAPAGTGIRVQWLREQFARCRAGVKLLVLDACHAGSAKGSEASPLRSIPTKDLDGAFGSVAGVYTLASSKAEETSMIWEEMKQSLFSYWLNLGLRGHADQNADGRVTTDELYQYVHHNVAATAKPILGKPQTPVRIVGPDLPGVPCVIRLAPTSLKVLFHDMAEQLASTVRLKGVSNLGITDFTASTIDAGLPSDRAGRLGTAGRYFATELERQLVSLSEQAAAGADRFSVVPNSALQKALGGNSLRPEDLESSAAKGMRIEAEGRRRIEGIGRGTVRVRTGQLISVQCELIDTTTQELVDSVGGTAELTEADWMSFGSSVRLDVPPPAPSADAPRPGDPVARLDDVAAVQTRHPLQAPGFPYPMKIMVVNGSRFEERPYVFHGKDCYVALRPKEVYQVWICNRSLEPLAMRLMVDGLDTRPKLVKTATGELRRSADGSAIEEFGPHRVSPEEARAWGPIPAGECCGIKGFYHKTPPRGKEEDVPYSEFTVVDIKDSIIARNVYTDPIGQISASFHLVKPKDAEASLSLPGVRTRGPLASDPGKKREEKVRSADSFDLGPLQAVVNIHYVSPQALEGLGK